jgi:hypothetical protein
LVENPILKKRVYGRKHGRPMHKGRTDVIETILPVLQIPKDKLKEDGHLTPKEILGAIFKNSISKLASGMANIFSTS